MTAGRLDIDLTVGAAGVSARLVRVPGPALGRLLAGKPRAAALTLVPAVLNLCAGAHRQAAAAAVGLPAGDADAACRDIVRDHTIAALRDWPACFGCGPDGDGLRLLAAAASGADRDGDRDRTAAAALRRHLCGGDADPARFEPADLARWLARGETATVRLLAEVRRRFRPEWGRAALPAPTLDEALALAAGVPVPAREATCADRVRGEPLLGAVEAVEGRSLFARLLARLLDLVRCLGAAAPPAGDVPPAGVGVAEASRGRLHHVARLDGERIAAYRVITPSDWNLADGGLLHRMMATLPADDRLEPAARLAVACADPCVPVALRFSHA